MWALRLRMSSSGLGRQDGEKHAFTLADGQEDRGLPRIFRMLCYLHEFEKRLRNFYTFPVITKSKKMKFKYFAIATLLFGSLAFVSCGDKEKSDSRSRAREAMDEAKKEYESALKEYSEKYDEAMEDYNINEEYNSAMEDYNEAMDDYQERYNEAMKDYNDAVDATEDMYNGQYQEQYNAAMEQYQEQYNAAMEQYNAAMESYGGGL